MFIPTPPPAPRKYPRGYASIFKTSRRNANTRDIPFDLTVEQFLQIVARADGRCELSGLPFDWHTEDMPTGLRHPYVPSLDRINNGEGYSLSNCRLVLAIANVAMNQWGIAPLTQLAIALVARKGALACSGCGTRLDSDYDYDNPTIACADCDAEVEAALLRRRNNRDGRLFASHHAPRRNRGGGDETADAAACRERGDEGMRRASDYRIGQRVAWTIAADAAGITLRESARGLGTVVGFMRSGRGIYVLPDGYKKRKSYSVNFWMPIENKETGNG